MYKVIPTKLHRYRIEIGTPTISGSRKILIKFISSYPDHISIQTEEIEHSAAVPLIWLEPVDHDNSSLLTHSSWGTWWDTHRVSMGSSGWRASNVRAWRNIREPRWGWSIRIVSWWGWSISHIMTGWWRSITILKQKEFMCSL